MKTFITNTDGKLLRITQRYLTQVSAFSIAWRVSLADVRTALKTSARTIRVHELCNGRSTRYSVVVAFRRPASFHLGRIGCSSFDRETFRTIVKAALAGLDITAKVKVAKAGA
jgi:hypothetical protein